ncbi:unnamed protein product [Urochloa humidicola]
MFLSHLLPSYLLVVIVILATIAGSRACICRQDQRAALLRLKAGFHFNYTASSNCQWYLTFELKDLSSWKVDTNCCNWEGVTCDGTLGYVTELNLYAYCISGNISSSSDIFNLTKLRSLNLAYNNFDGSQWPTPGFEQLTDLKYLDLANSGLSVDVPIQNGQLSNLETLDLSGLDLKYSSLETLIHNHGGPQKLYLNFSKIFVGPNDLAHASSTNTKSVLKVLVMQGCTVTGGSFEHVLTNLLLFHSKLPNLVTLYLSYFDLNNLSLHTLIVSLRNIQELYLEDVSISVSPTDLGHLTSGLKHLSMRSCTITAGQFDIFLTKLPLLSNLLMLDLDSIDLKNLSLAALLHNLESLQKLNLNIVSISVTPTDLAHASSTNMTSGLTDLSLVWCMITGRIDIALTKFRSLSKLTLDGSNFSSPAPVPKHFVEFSSLTDLSLAGCGLTRKTVPSWIFRIKSLISLDLSDNENLSGTLPEFIQGSALQFLLLSGTKLSGTIPESISNLHNLTELDLSNCQFHGLIPSFAQWPKIMTVDLSGNNLTGSLPSDGYLSLHNLSEIYLSKNSISGEIPGCLFSHPSLKILDLSQNNLTGNFLLYPNISSSLMEIDVSFNKLQGPLPKLLSKFIGLKQLDLSSNNLIGTVDLSFMKNYKKLTYLSLSDNKLSVVEEYANQYVRNRCSYSLRGEG